MRTTHTTRAKTDKIKKKHYTWFPINTIQSQFEEHLQTTIFCTNALYNISLKKITCNVCMNDYRGKYLPWVLNNASNFSCRYIGSIRWKYAQDFQNGVPDLSI
jgi:hypothetical protein